jgi:antitoxin CptB
MVRAASACKLPLAMDRGRGKWVAAILFVNRFMRATMSEELSEAKKRLLYRAKYRGFKEADIVVGKFAEKHLGGLTDEETEEFRLLLEVPDQELYGWIIGREEAPDNYKGSVLTKMQAFDVAAEMPR